MIISTTHEVPGRISAGPVGDGLVEAICISKVPDAALAQARAALIAKAEDADALTGYHATATYVPDLGFAVTASATAVRLVMRGVRVPE